MIQLMILKIINNELSTRYSHVNLVLGGDKNLSINAKNAIESDEATNFVSIVTYGRLLLK